MHQCIHLSCLGPSFSTTQRPCSLQPQHHTRCRAQHRPRGHEAAAAAEATTTTSSSTSLQVRRLQQPQHMFGDMPAQQHDPTKPPEQVPPQASKPPKSAGFGGAKNSRSSGSSSGTKQQQQQQQQWAVVKLHDSCPCRSGLRYQVGSSYVIRKAWVRHQVGWVFCVCWPVAVVFRLVRGAHAVVHMLRCRHAWLQTWAHRRGLSSWLCKVQGSGRCLGVRG